MHELPGGVKGFSSFSLAVVSASVLARISQCAVERLEFSSGWKSRPAKVAPAGSSRSGSGGDKTVEAFDGRGRVRRLSKHPGRNASERRAGLEKGDVEADPPE